MEPLPFAVIAERASLDDQGRLSLGNITDTIKVIGIPTAVEEFHLAALFLAGPEEFDPARSTLVRLVDPDGGEADVWRVRGQEIPAIGRPRSYNRILLHYAHVPFGVTGTHEIRIKYHDDAPELCVPFDVREDSSDV